MVLSLMNGEVKRLGENCVGLWHQRTARPLTSTTRAGTAQRLADFVDTAFGVKVSSCEVRRDFLWRRHSIKHSYLLRVFTTVGFTTTVPASASLLQPDG
jgi:hypothetical protein